MVDSPDFPFDWQTHRAFAESAYRNDTRLYKLLPRLVPKHVSEEDFWRNYFSHVYAVKCRFANSPPALPEPPTAPPTAPLPGVVVADSGAARLTRAASLTSQLPYPERFELALKYVREGPSLPDDAAPGDRILMDVLSQQATIGQCNAPRPGLFDGAEAKARHDAWQKLGSMSKHEAMHLYVQALEIFRKDWVLWDGLQITPDMVKRADAVATPKRALPDGLPSPAADGASAAHERQPPPNNGAVAGAPSSPPSLPRTPAALASAAGTSSAHHAENGGIVQSPRHKERMSIFLLDISPSSRAVALLLEMLPAARHVRTITVSRISELPEPVQKGCAKLPLLVEEQHGFELWDAHAIMGYLVEKYAPAAGPAPTASFFLPRDCEGKAKVQEAPLTRRRASVAAPPHRPL